jgi:hypothetical protein
MLCLEQQVLGMLVFIKHLQLHVALFKNTISSTYILFALTVSSISAARTQFILVPEGDINCLNVLLSKPQQVFTLHDI